MRVQQSKVATSWITRSDDPAQSLRAWVAGMSHEILVDDQGVMTRMKPLEVVAPDENDGIVFFAKDWNTLSRGFQYMANSGKTQGKREYFLRGRGELDLAALAIRWDDGISRYSNSAIAGISTVGFNASLAFRRGMFRAFGVKIGDNDRYQSVSGNMEASGRDGKLLQRGAALYVCISEKLPLNLPWGRPYRQIGPLMTMGMLATVTNQLFGK